MSTGYRALIEDSSPHRPPPCTLPGKIRRFIESARQGHCCAKPERTTAVRSASPVRCRTWDAIPSPALHTGKCRAAHEFGVKLLTPMPATNPQICAGPSVRVGSNSEHFSETRSTDARSGAGCRLRHTAAHPISSLQPAAPRRSIKSVNFECLPPKRVIFVRSGVSGLARVPPAPSALDDVKRVQRHTAAHCFLPRFHIIALILSDSNPFTLSDGFRLRIGSDASRSSTHAAGLVRGRSWSIAVSCAVHGSNSRPCAARPYCPGVRRGLVESHGNRTGARVVAYGEQMVPPSGAWLARRPRYTLHCTPTSAS